MRGTLVLENLAAVEGDPETRLLRASHFPFCAPVAKPSADFAGEEESLAVVLNVAGICFVKIDHDGHHATGAVVGVGDVGAEGLQSSGVIAATPVVTLYSIAKPSGLSNIFDFSAWLTDIRSDG